MFVESLQQLANRIVGQDTSAALFGDALHQLGAGGQFQLFLAECTHVEDRPAE